MKIIVGQNGYTYGPANSLQTECWDTQGYSRGKLDEEHIEGVEDGFMTVDVWVFHLEVIHYIRKHRPTSTNMTIRGKLDTVNKDPHLRTNPGMASVAGYTVIFLFFNQENQSKCWIFLCSSGAMKILPFTGPKKCVLRSEILGANNRLWLFFPFVFN